MARCCCNCRGRGGNSGTRPEASVAVGDRPGELHLRNPRSPVRRRAGVRPHCVGCGVGVAAFRAAGAGIGRPVEPVQHRPRRPRRKPAAPRLADGPLHQVPVRRPTAIPNVSKRRRCSRKLPSTRRRLPAELVAAAERPPTPAAQWRRPPRCSGRCRVRPNPPTDAPLPIPGVAQPVGAVSGIHGAAARLLVGEGARRAGWCAVPGRSRSSRTSPCSHSPRSPRCCHDRRERQIGSYPNQLRWNAKAGTGPGAEVAGVVVVAEPALPVAQADRTGDRPSRLRRSRSRACTRTPAGRTPPARCRREQQASVLGGMVGIAVGEDTAVGRPVAGAPRCGRPRGDPTARLPGVVPAAPPASCRESTWSADSSGNSKARPPGRRRLGQISSSSAPAADRSPTRHARPMAQFQSRAPIGGRAESPPQSAHPEEVLPLVVPSPIAGDPRHVGSVGLQVGGTSLIGAGGSLGTTGPAQRRTRPVRRNPGAQVAASAAARRPAGRHRAERRRISSAAAHQPMMARPSMAQMPNPSRKATLSWCGSFRPRRGLREPQPRRPVVMRKRGVGIAPRHGGSSSNPIVAGAFPQSRMRAIGVRGKV